MNGYKAFYKGRTADIYAETSYAAQQQAAAKFKVKKAYDVTVVLCETDVTPGKQGVQVTHSTAML